MYCICLVSSTYYKHDVKDKNCVSSYYYYYYFTSAAVTVDCSHTTASSFASCSRFDVVSLCYAPDDGTLGCRDTPRWSEGCAGPGRRLESHWTRLLVWFARLDRDPAHSAHGFGQQVASLVLWFGFDDWAIDLINREATRSLKPSPACD